MLRRIGIVCLAALASLTGSISAWAIGPEKPGWRPPELVAPDALLAGHDGADRILAYDHYGCPAVVFSAENPPPGIPILGPAVWYARRVPGYGWGVGKAIGTSGLTVSGSLSLVFDRHELPIVGCAYGETRISRLYAGNGWSWGESFDKPATQWCSVAVDLYGRAAMAFHYPSPGGHPSLLLAYDRDDNNAFGDFTGPYADLTIVKQNLNGRYVSLAFDQSNRPMMAYQDADSQDLMFAVQDAGTAWLNMTVDSAGSQGWMPSLAVNPMTGYPAIAYAGDGGANLRYAEWDGHDWQMTVLPNDRGNAIEGVSLAFDPADGNPAIAYREGDPLGGGPAPDWNFGLLAFTWRHEDTWENQVIAWEGDTGLHPSVAFNDYGPGWAGIAYLDTLGNVWYVEDPPAVPEPATLALLAAGVAAVAVGRGRGDRRRS